MHDFIKSLYVDYFMKKGRHYIKPKLSTGDKKGTNIPEKKNKVGASGKTWDGVSRPSSDLYRESFNRIFGVKDDER